MLYPESSNREIVDAYARLESAAFQFKEQRPALRIVDRFHLNEILEEQRFQMSGDVSDETAIRLGRLLGVDCVLLYQIDGPSMRDWVLADNHGDLPPFHVKSKIVSVESAEVLFHNAVTAQVDGHDVETPRFYNSESMSSLARAALDRGVERTIHDLRHAFR